MDLDRLTGRFGPLSRAGSAVNLVISTGLLVMSVAGDGPWALIGILWLVFLAATIWAWTRRYTVFGTIGVQLGVAEAGPYEGRDLVVIHDGTTWTVEVDSPRSSQPRTLTFDNDEFPGIREQWRIRWTS